MNPLVPDNCKMNNAARTGINKLPDCFKQEIPDEETLGLKQLLSEFGISTVCQEARCPNITYCYKNKKFTFMILGNTCTRKCSFCAVAKTDSDILVLDEDEPSNISSIVRQLDLKYVVITSVTRDDLSDGGAGHFSRCLESIHSLNRDIKVEVLIPDFKGRISSLKCVLDAAPCVLAHNIETVRRLYKDLRPQSNYRLSLDILSKAKELQPGIITKSSIMLGLGETETEVIDTMEDLRQGQCDILALGQYLAPSVFHYPIKEFINIEQFQRYRDIGLTLGFKKILSGPLIRSSYKAEDIYQESIRA